MKTVETEKIMKNHISQFCLFLRITIAFNKNKSVQKKQFKIKVI